MEYVGYFSILAIIGFVGWFAEWDRLDKLIEVFNRVSTQMKNVTLMLVGDGHIRTDLEKLIEKYGIGEKVVMTGSVARENVQNGVHKRR